MLLAWALAALPLPQGLGGEDPYPAYVWRWGGPKATAEWGAALRNLGFSGTNLRGSEKPDFALSLGLGFYTDVLVARDVFHRDSNDAKWKAAVEEYEKLRTTAPLLRAPCLDEPAVLERIKAQAAQSASLHGPAGARFLSIADEPSYTCGICPLDYDHAPAAVAAFRRRLRERFSGIEEIAKLFAAPIPSTEELRPWTTDEIRSRELAHGPPWNFFPWAASRESADRSLAESMGAAIAAARAAAPGVAVGFLGAQPPSAFGGFDWGLLMAQKPDLLEVYDVGAARDLVRGLAPGALFADTTFADEAQAPYTADLSPARLSWMFARGGRAAIVWGNKAVFEGEDPAKPTALGKTLGERVRELRRIAATLKGAAPEFDSIGVVLSAPSVRLGWMLDSQRDGKRWLLRKSSYEYRSSTALASFEGWIRLAEDLGLSTRTVDARSLSDASAALPSVLILPRCFALSGGEIDGLKRHLGAGGTVLAEGRPALFDADLIGGSGAGPADALFGLRPAPFAGFADADCAPARGAARDTAGLVYLEAGLRAVDGTPLRTAAASDGRAVLFNLSFTEYRDARLAPDSRSAAELRALVAPLLERGALAPRLRVRSATGIPLSLHRERRGDDLFVLVSANVRRAPDLASKAPRPLAAMLELAADAPHAPVGDEGELRSEAPGRYSFSLDPLHLTVLKISR